MDCRRTQSRKHKVSAKEAKNVNMHNSKLQSTHLLQNSMMMYMEENTNIDGK